MTSTTSIDRTSVHERGRAGVTTNTVAAWASIGAGAIHAAAIGLHTEHRQTALAFTAVAAFQVLWGMLALAVPSRVVAAVGTVGSAGLVVGFLAAKTSGIGFVDGLETVEAVQLPDTVAAMLAAGVVVLTLASMLGHRGLRPLGRASSMVGIVAVVGLTLPGLVGASSPSHEHGEGAEADHAVHDEGHEAATDAVAGADDPHAGHESAAVAPTPYDPSMPIDLGGVDGVTPQQQAAAENLIAITLADLPQFADTANAEAAGYHSIRDGATGHEHYINWDYIDDDRILDPDYPESLVYEMRNGEKTLVSAMFMLGTGTTLDDVPELGGPLTQWHIHDNLCFTDDPVAPVVAGLIAADGSCSPPLVKLAEVPMIHVWIVSHPCGPFAALDGVGAGQIAEGEERLCDHAHGA